ncbi:SPOR domain-containing protein [Propionivibrio sp.]|uniref:SPOR domain-containing protein n=1 Tax=Propionivibrio sp. TaxID=2212460 RepID=UPI0025D7B332|nr:SPOR domain-containing protein [Propionivibrio sp.]MBK7355244.1 SPOR domain-containing protein [Propionivibrio sp.]MBK8399639.1 SPOR domain-containing protein [Propionivibrio sp.]MBK8744932.1 SPOR domain-containing protein [Propionivibrio sp.]MBL0208619.1 SPOR domain-containing protein [Propionivibrio sp.]
MKKFLTRFLLVASLLTIALPLNAAPQTNRAYALVESVQMPAWVERKGARQPLEAGEALQSNDRVVTGADAKVLIRLAEGSAVKLGESAELELNALGWRDSSVFTAALDVVKGAFRFTTGIFSKRRQQREVNVRIATITAGIRGTDLWGSSDSERDLVCLLEGRITVSHAQDKAHELSEALSFYTAPKGKAPNPIGKVDPEQIKRWAAQTEVSSGNGYTRRGGRWMVELAAYDNEKDALDLYDRARAAGYAVQIKPRRTKGESQRYAVRIAQVASRTEAAVLAEKLRQRLELGATVVSRQP